jgi:Amt family ammonium transporter
MLDADLCVCVSSIVIIIIIIIIIIVQMLGTLTLWFGWYGFNAGSALITNSPRRDQLTGLAAVNTTLSGGIAGMVALFVNYLVLERTLGEPVFDLKMAMNGTLGGLVAITSGCGVVEPWAAILIGAIAGLIYLSGTQLLVRLRLDDAVDAIPVHMMNGIWGMIAVGLLASSENLEMVFGREVEHVGLIYSFRNGTADAHLLAANLVGILFIFGWVLGIMLPFFVWLDWKGWFRSDPLEEIVGLDTSYHGGLFLNTGEESVNPEYITQFRKQRNELRNRRRPSYRDDALPSEEVSEEVSNTFGDDIEERYREEDS